MNLFNLYLFIEIGITDLEEKACVSWPPKPQCRVIPCDRCDSFS
jgi:hypothetical protein